MTLVRHISDGTTPQPTGKKQKNNKDNDMSDTYDVLTQHITYMGVRSTTHTTHIPSIRVYGIHMLQSRVICVMPLSGWQKYLKKQGK